MVHGRYAVFKEPSSKVKQPSCNATTTNSCTYQGDLMDGKGASEKCYNAARRSNTYLPAPDSAASSSSQRHAETRRSPVLHRGVPKRSHGCHPASATCKNLHYWPSWAVCLFQAPNAVSRSPFSIVRGIGMRAAAYLTRHVCMQAAPPVSVHVRL